MNAYPFKTLKTEFVSTSNSFKTAQKTRLRKPISAPQKLDIPLLMVKFIKIKLVNQFYVTIQIISIKKTIQLTIVSRFISMLTAE